MKEIATGEAMGWGDNSGNKDKRNERKIKIRCDTGEEMVKGKARKI